MAQIKCIIVSNEEGLYDRISRQIREETPEVACARVETMREGVALLEANGKGIILADMNEALLNVPIFNDEENFYIPAFEEAASEDPEKMKAHLDSIKYYVRMHLHEDLSLKKVSSYACLSSNYLSFLFRKWEDMTYHEYVVQNRMQKAAYLILTEDSAITEIARRVGFSHSSYFCRVFKQFYGISPLQYRIQNRHQIPEV